MSLPRPEKSTPLNTRLTFLNTLRFQNNPVCRCRSSLNRLERGEKAVVTLNVSDVLEILNHAFGRTEKPSGKVLAVMPPETNLQMMLQGSRFTIHGPNDSLADRPTNDTYLSKWAVPAESKARVRDQLQALGVQRSSLFPDLRSLAEDVRNGVI